MSERQKRQTNNIIDGDKQNPMTVPRQVPLGVMGIILLANPLYLDQLSSYPLIGWGDMPLFVAGFTVLGFLCVGLFLAGSGNASSIQRKPEFFIVFGVSFVSVVSLGLYLTLLPLVWEPVEGVIEGFFWTQLLVGSLVASGTILGGLAHTGWRHTVVGVVSLIVPFLLLYLFSWQFDPILEPIVDLWIFFTSDRVLGVPYFGTLLVIGAIVLGRLHYRLS